MLSQELLARGLSLAERERATRWDWGDWAVAVAGPTGEVGHQNGSHDKLAAALEEIAANGESTISELPSVDLLRQYREAASAIPPELRTAVRSIDVARKLATRVPDLRERHALIEALANDKGIVTERAVREHFGMASKDGAVAKERDELRKREDAAKEYSRQRTVGELMDGEAIPDFSASWADKLVLRVHTNTQHLTSLIESEGLRFCPTTPLQEMYGYLIDAERRIADVRAAVQERLQDEAVI